MFCSNWLLLLPLRHHLIEFLRCMLRDSVKQASLYLEIFIKIL